MDGHVDDAEHGGSSGPRAHASAGRARRPSTDSITAGGGQAERPGPGRWWIYQRERFPLLAHTPLVLAFSTSAVSFSWLLHPGPDLPPLLSYAVAFFTSLVFFLQLRIADEFKDHEEDRRYRPYRPVPRGLVTLRELGMVFALGALLQLGLALLLAPRLLLLLGITWAYLAAMSKEFFVGTWLRARPLLYMVTHMTILPLIDLYATSTEWTPRAGDPPAGLFFFLLASLFNGMVVEIGRKIRRPADEEEGVPTYSHLWGRPRAVGAWLGALVATTVSALLAASRIGFILPLAVLLGAGLLVATWAALRFLRATNAATPARGNARPGRDDGHDARGGRPAPGPSGRIFETVAAAWTLVLYVGLGLLPFFLRLAGSGP